MYASRSRLHNPSPPLCSYRSGISFALLTLSSAHLRKFHLPENDSLRFGVKQRAFRIETSATAVEAPAIAASSQRLSEYPVS